MRASCFGVSSGTRQQACSPLVIQMLRQTEWVKIQNVVVAHIIFYMVSQCTDQRRAVHVQTCLLYFRDQGFAWCEAAPCVILIA